MAILVCGLGIVSAIGNNADQCFNSIKQNRTGIGALTIFSSQLNVPVGQVNLSNEQLKQMLKLDFNKTTSRTALLGILAAKQAIEDANIPQSAKIGLVSSTSVGGMDLTENFYTDYLTDKQNCDIEILKQHDCSFSTQQIADYCNINGFTTTISTACSSAANAIIYGINLLNSNIVDYVLVGGTDALSKFTLNGFNSLRLLDDKPCAPFSQNRNGLNLGEGAAYLVLCRDGACPVSDSECTIQNKYCQITGYANKNDAFHQTASSDNGDGAFYAMQKALNRASLLTQDINYINVHGTGTQSNDSSEAKAISRLFDTIPNYSSTKGFTGHTLAASGAIESVLSVLALKYGALLPNCGFKTIIPEISSAPVTEYSENNTIKNIMTNSFGFGGNCTSLIFSKNAE